MVNGVDQKRYQELGNLLHAIAMSIQLCYPGSEQKRILRCINGADVNLNESRYAHVGTRFGSRQ
jgi:hypothetical protein